MSSIRFTQALYFLLVSAGAAIAQEPAVPGNLPSGAGVYYHQGEATWIVLTRPVMAATKTEGMEHFLDTRGWSNLSRTIVSGVGRGCLDFAGVLLPGELCNEHILR